jgi:ParB family transcriptional regulator, chromosome partitioning protein
LARPDFRAMSTQRLSEERELGPSIISLLSPEGTNNNVGVRHVPVGRIEANPDQPRMVFEQTSLDELAASVREHGILQPVLVRPFGAPGHYQLVAGERRWRAAKAAGLSTIPAMIEELDDETSLEIAIIENLQREDLSPLEEATMYDRMVKDHGYSIRRLAQKLGKDKGYLENRLRLADAPEEIRELVSLRKDTISHAYELMKVEDPRKRRRLAAQVASGELSLVKLRQRIEGRRGRRAEEPGDGGEVETGQPAPPSEGLDQPATAAKDRAGTGRDPSWQATAHQTGQLSDDSLVVAKQGLADAVEELIGVLREQDVLSSIHDVDRSNLAKYLTIAKLRLENAIALVRSGEID